MKAIFALFVCGLSCVVSGCATRGSIHITCTDFHKHVDTAEASQLIRDIQSDVTTPLSPVPADDQDRGSVALVPDGLKNGSAGDAGEEGKPSLLVDDIAALSLENARRLPAQFEKADEKSRPAGILLLSGGGQWGAFGAGFLKALQGSGASSEKDKAVDFRVITGVSTGGLQSLFVAIEDVDPTAYERLSANYLPKQEEEIVNQNPKIAAAVTGSFAGLRPLRRKIEGALCTNGDPDQGCPMIEKLACSKRRALIGFVNAETGAFEYADAVGFARAAETSGEARRNAQQCLTGIALASAAMPVFFQQVQINGKTYYDGGVRQSVFEENIAAAIDRALVLAKARRADDPGLRATTGEPTAPPLYVIRNGPTQLLAKTGQPGSNGDANKAGDALTAAERAEAILVNQLEVGSIANLRLAHPTGDIWLVTADGFHAWKARPDDDPLPKPRTCPRNGKMMFDPDFMACLQEFGAFKAKRQHPWQSLSPLKLEPPAEASVPSPVPAS